MKALLCLAGISLAAFVQAADKQPIVGIWLMGQSLCDGSESLPLVTPKDTGFWQLCLQTRRADVVAQ